MIRYDWPFVMDFSDFNRFVLEILLFVLCELQNDIPRIRKIRITFFVVILIFLLNLTHSIRIIFWVIVSHEKRKNTF